MHAVADRAERRLLTPKREEKVSRRAKAISKLPEQLSYKGKVMASLDVTPPLLLPSLQPSGC
jgi:hypothetical protein